MFQKEEILNLGNQAQVLLHHPVSPELSQLSAIGQGMWQLCTWDE